jgi:hypothetical protein
MNQVMFADGVMGSGVNTIVSRLGRDVIMERMK